ncbi:hypothetical protein RRG08_005905 [Elysia crispata]|uniref:Uncharacterized protein n=1 Tax=Elysia crispata TaxID=231223 RepID=A0AAE0Y5J2_9GAST|nr:hypothetical protein RRG08_005905 [Elysia crispata]
MAQLVMSLLVVHCDQRGEIVFKKTSTPQPWLMTQKLREGASTNIGQLAGDVANASLDPEEPILLPRLRSPENQHLLILSFDT